MISGDIENRFSTRMRQKNIDTSSYVLKMRGKPLLLYRIDQLSVESERGREDLRLKSANELVLGEERLRTWETSSVGV